MAACFVGAATLTTSLRIGLALLAFYYTSSKLTAFKEEMKDVDEHFKKGGQRDWRQVLLSLLLLLSNPMPTMLLLGIVR